MRFTRQILRGALLLSMLGSGSRALAQNAATPAQVERLQADCARLRIELDGVNSEIAALKRADRNVRNEYRLREKMADAEALARKLTEAERLVRNGRPAAAPASVAAPMPAATAQDGAVELEAKADLMADQAHRFVAEADSLARTAEEIRNRQALRRRASNWERDPFAGFEGSKRSLVVQQQRSNALAGAPTQASDSARSGGGTGAAESSKSAASVPADQGATGANPTTGGASPVFGGGPGSGPSTSTSGPPSSLTPSASAAPSSSPTAGSPLAPAVASKPGLLPRTLLDPASLADIRQSLSASGSLSDPDALDAAVAALRQRARALQEEAKDLRARARQH